MAMYVYHPKGPASSYTIKHYLGTPQPLITLYDANNVILWPSSMNLSGDKNTLTIDFGEEVDNITMIMLTS